MSQCRLTGDAKKSADPHLGKKYGITEKKKKNAPEQ